MENSFITDIELEKWAEFYAARIRLGMSPADAVEYLYGEIKQPVTDAMLEVYNSARGTGLQASNDLVVFISETFDSGEALAQRLQADMEETGGARVDALLREHASFIWDRLYQAQVLGRLDRLKDTGYTMYQYRCSTDDRVTCGDCAALADRVFDVSEAERGVNLPQLHPNCRCSIRPFPYEAELPDADTQTVTVNWGKEIINFILPGSWERGQKWLDSPYDFINWLLMGLPDAMRAQYVRTTKAFDSVYDFFNWLTMGAADTFAGAVAPEEPLSAEHWQNSLYAALLLTLPVRVAGKTAANPKIVRVQQQAVNEIKRGRTVVMQEIADRDIAGWPKNGGFAGKPVDKVLRPGTLIDRYGGSDGYYASPKGTPFAKRAMPPSYANRTLTVYEVMEPVTVKSGKAARWFGQPGGGTQYMFEKTVQELLDEGVLKEVIK